MTSPKESGTPRTITAGYWLVVAGAVLTVLAALFVLYIRQAVIDANVKADPSRTVESITRDVDITWISALVGSLVLGGLAVWFARRTKAGAKRSRTSLMITVLLGLFFQMTISPLGVVGALVGMVGLGAFYFRQSTEFLTEREQLT
ncbi:hypothetical protein [Lentzea sp. NBRC 102530]|uniref:hypothetical protein n=1 Tax=Lentzea sp. NBRC 102530 TaxID=3032201 RepID=UPI0024A465DC|nr:hypothetical protein [Lentzea sp. NBRC 102530]GLY53861.1 hypothetical protein Lesp01_75170 [Lentzea sp. NBRC 102530]